MADADPKVPAYDAEYTLFGVPIQVFMLADGTRVVAAGSLGALTAAILSKADADTADNQQELQAFGRWLHGLPKEK